MRHERPTEMTGFACGHCLFLILQKGNCVQLESNQSLPQIKDLLIGHQTAWCISEFQYIESYKQLIDKNKEQRLTDGKTNI